jgi:hypothetical protein
MTHPTLYKYAAGLAWKRKKGNAAAATTAFHKYLLEAGYELPTNPHEYVTTWGPRLHDNGEIEDHASNRGRPKTLTVAQIATCYVECLNWWQAGRAAPYASAEQLITDNAVVHTIVTDAGITPETLTRNLKDYDPHFKYGPLHDRAYLDERHRQDRVECSMVNKERLPADKPYVVWVDEKVLCLSQETCMGWYSSAAEDYHWRLPVPTHQSKPIKIKYIIGVNYLLGPVWIKFFTGTSGMPANREGHAYVVSSALE